MDFNSVYGWFDFRQRNEVGSLILNYNFYYDLVFGLETAFLTWSH